MPKAKSKLTASMFYQYDFCPHWIWFDLFADKRKKGQMGELMEKLIEQGVAHEQEYIEDKSFVEVPVGKTEDAARATMTLMEQGVETIYQGALVAKIDERTWSGRPDLLVRKSGRSTFGDYYYEAVDIKSSRSLKTVQKMQLTFYALLLEHIQGTFPKHCSIININHEHIDFKPKPFLKRFSRRKNQIEAVLDGEKPELVLTRTCLQGPWNTQCVAQAEEANDISLLYNVNRHSISALRKVGINTVDDAALMNPATLPKIPYMNSAALDRMKLQAESLAHKEIRVIKTPKIPNTGLLIHFDIEGDPLLGVEYLFGFLREDTNEYLMFLAEQPEQEEHMWKQFLRWLKTLPEEYTVFHYAPYEKSRLTMLEEKYGGSNELETFTSNLFDLFTTVKQCLIFPLYFYSIKDICKHLGFSWRHKKAGGAQSIFWYEKWLATNDREVLNDIIRYNEDDVRATVFLKNWLKDRLASDMPHYGN